MCGKLLLLFLLAFNVPAIVVAQAYDVPVNLKPIRKNSGTIKFKVLKNPFYLYLDFVQLSEKCLAVEQGHKAESVACICYWGYDGPKNLTKLKYTLTPLEREHYKKAKLAGEKMMDVDCKSSADDEPYLSYRLAEDQYEKLDLKNYFQFLYAGYTGRALNQQKVCFEGVKIAEEAGLSLYEISLNSTGQGKDYLKHVATVNRSNVEGYIKVLFNLRQPVMQPFGNVKADVDFFVTPQFAAYQAFTDKSLIEETFITMYYQTCRNIASYLYYDPDELSLIPNEMVFPYPDNDEGYIGSLLEINNATEEIVQRNRTEYDNILAEEIEFQTFQRRRDFN